VRYTAAEGTLRQEEVVRDWQTRIAIHPQLLVGKPTVKGTRLAVELIIDPLAQGWTEAELRHNDPGLTHEDIQACLGYASATLLAEKVYPIVAAQPMRVLANENFPGDTVAALRLQGSTRPRETRS